MKKNHRKKFITYPDECPKCGKKLEYYSPEMAVEGCIWIDYKCDNLPCNFYGQALCSFQTIIHKNKSYKMNHDTLELEYVDND